MGKDNNTDSSGRSVSHMTRNLGMNNTPRNKPIHSSQLAFDPKFNHKRVSLGTGDNTRYKSNKMQLINRNSIEDLISNENPKGSLFAVNGLFAKLSGYNDGNDSMNVSKKAQVKVKKLKKRKIS